MTANNRLGVLPSSMVSAMPPTQASFPRRQMFILALCRICEPIAFMSIFPYTYYMIQDFHITEDQNKISFYAGMVTSAFTFAEFSTGFFWGRLSDKVGRKPVILTGLLGTGLSALLFGFAPNLTVALFARALGGFLNGNIGVLQTTVAELITTKEHQPRAYSIMPLVWCLGSIIGPAMGGALARPCEGYPGWCAAGSVWQRFPYLLPNVFSAVCVFCGLIIGILFFEETHAVKKYDRDRGVEFGRYLLSLCSWPCCTTARAGSGESGAENSAKLSKSAEAEDPREDDHDQDEQLPRYRSTEGSPELSPTFVPEVGDQNLTDPCPVYEQRTFTRPVVLNIISYGILAFHTISFDSLFPVFLSTDRPTNTASHSDLSHPLKFVGGFGLGTQTIGRILAVQGVFSLVSTCLLFPLVSKRLGALHTFQLVAVSYFLLYIATPYLAILPEGMQMGAILVILAWKCTLSTLAYPSNAMLTSNSAPSNLLLGTINGVAASTASLCRAFGPAVSGMFYTLGLQSGYSGLAWWISGGVTIVGAVISLQLTEPKGWLDQGADDLESVPLLAPADPGNQVEH